MTDDSHRAKAKQHTPSGEAFTRLILEAFPFNGCLLAAGDRLTQDLGLTSARWQVLGAIDEGPLPVAQISRNMGLSRQAVQRVANELAAGGFVAFADNPNHRRAKLVELTEIGRQALDEITQRQAAWANRIAAGIDASVLDAAANVLLTLRSEIEADDANSG
jgi:DNA-binding MarR family transcriptional regulator